MPPKVLITGISGFIASHCALNLLSNGYSVRGSLRDLARADELRNMFRRHGGDTGRLELVEANLTDDACWSEAVQGCEGVFHIASPVPVIQPKNPQDVIEPARTGTLNVLKAARNAGIKRVVLTSSVVTILGGDAKDRPYTAEDWSNPDDPCLTPYAISKTIAERVAWDYCADNDVSLTTIHPAMVLGPALEADYGSSLEALVKLMKRHIPLLPKYGFEIVDVRDVADLHRLAFEHNDTSGQRLIAANGFRWFREIAQIIQTEFPDTRIPRQEMPNWLARIVSLFVRELGTIINELEQVKKLDNQPAKRLGWQPRTPEEAILSGARSLVALGLV